MAARGGPALDVTEGRELEALLGPLRAGLGKDCLSEYAFANLFLFRAAHRYRYLPGPHPCVSGVTYDGALHLLPLFDVGEAPADALAGLLAGGACLYPLPERALARLDPDRFCWSAVRSDADYLYRAEGFRSYRGRRLRKKRNQMKQLLASHRVEARPLGGETLRQARELLAGWMRDKAKARGEADEPECLEALEHLAVLGLEGAVYCADGDPAGFLVWQELAPGVHTIRFAKGVDAYRGIYPYMFHHFCSAPPPGRPRVEWVNFEQDLGLDNFRRTKLSYEPDQLLAKYRVRLRR